jgi:carboxymethylenebutenolidase
MAIRGEWIRYGGGSGYFARPDNASASLASALLPGVLVIQEVGGVNDHIEDVTRRIAAAGYAALAPDLFAVDGERPAALSRERIAEAFRVAATFPPGTMFDPAARAAALGALGEQGRRIGETFGQAFSFAAPARAATLMAPLRQAFRHLREERAETRGQRTACVGFCMGGGLSALLACEEEELSGAAIYYGMSPPAERVAAISCPVIGFYGALDERVNATLPAFGAAMRAAGKSFESHVYEGASHAFFNDDAPSYSAPAARDSYSRLLAFFAKALSG